VQGGKVQNKFALFAQRLEKIVLLLDWSKPEHTAKVMYVLGGAVLVTSTVPPWLLGPIVKVWFGVNFFIKSYVFHRYHHLKVKYDSTYVFWCNLPDKQTVDYATASQPNLKKKQTKGKTSASNIAPLSSSPVKAPYAATHTAFENPMFESFDADVSQTAAAAMDGGGADADAVRRTLGALGGRDGATELGSWSCVYLNDKVTASKAGRLILTETTVYFKTGEDCSLFNHQVSKLVGVMSGDVLKTAQEGKTGMLAALSKLGSKLGDKLGIGSLVLKLADSSHTFTTMPKRDEAGVAIGNAAPAGVSYTLPTAKE
jgi:hypothetical protein